MTLRRIDLTGNMISEIEDGAFSKLIMLEQLSLAENRLVKLPMLPAKLSTFNANNNFLKTKGVKANVFKVNFITSALTFRNIPAPFRSHQGPILQTTVTLIGCYVTYCTTNSKKISSIYLDSAIIVSQYSL